MASKMVASCLLVLIMVQVALAQLTIEQCGPLYTTTKVQCEQRAAECLEKFGVVLKWTGRGTRDNQGRPMGDGGCQCDQYCGYLSGQPCARDPQCHWTKEKKCYNNLTGKPGGPILICPPATVKPSGPETRAPTTRNVITKAPTTSTHAPTCDPATTGRPSLAETRAPATRAPISRRPTHVPTERPISDTCHAEVCFAKEIHGGDFCFIHEMNSWGFTNYVDRACSKSFEIWAGTDCECSRNRKVGTGTLVFDGHNAVISYSMIRGASLGSIAFYVGKNKYPLDHDGHPSLSPDRFCHKEDHPAHEHRVSIPVPDGEPFWYILRFEVDTCTCEW